MSWRQFFALVTPINGQLWPAWPELNLDKCGYHALKSNGQFPTLIFPHLISEVSIPAVWRESHARDQFLRLATTSRLFSGLQIPQPHGLILST
jgi:hypothetical protein